MSKSLYFATLIAATAALTGCNKDNAGKGAPPPPAVTVAKPVAKNVMEWDEYVGRLAAPQSVEVRARVSGYMDKVHFKEGSDVKEGDVLFTIDPRPYKAVFDRAKAEYDRAKARLELSQADARRSEGLFKSKTIASEEYETRTQGLAEAAANLRSAEAALETAKLDLEFTSVRSPITGRISNALVTVGNLVNGGNTGATVLTTVVSLDPIYCYVDVDERSALKYRELFRQGKRASALYGQVEARMGLANEEGYSHEGVIDFVDNQISPSTGAIRARGVFANPDRLMAPGFFARLRVPGSGEYPAVLVRDSAVGSDQGKPFVLVVDDKGTVAQRPVTLGPLEDGLRVVRDGLRAEDKVIVNGVMSARPGAAVRIAEETSMKPVAAIASNDPAAPAK